MHEPADTVRVEDQLVDTPIGCEHRFSDPITTVVHNVLQIRCVAEDDPNASVGGGGETHGAVGDANRDRSLRHPGPGVFYDLLHLTSSGEAHPYISVKANGDASGVRSWSESDRRLRRGDTGDVRDFRECRVGGIDHPNTSVLTRGDLYRIRTEGYCCFSTPD